MLASDYQIYTQIFNDVLLVPDTMLGTATAQKMCQDRHLGTLRTEGDDVIKEFLPSPSWPVKMN